jgi:DNA-binding transcriptional LysR family regulator
LAVLPRGDVVAECDSKRLLPERYVLVGPPAWTKRRLAEVVATERIVDFDPRDRATHAVLKRLGVLEQARADRHFVNNTDALASMVEDGVGYSALAAEFAAPRLKEGRLAQLGGARHFDMELALAWYPRRHMAGYFRDVIRAIK